MTKVIFLDIDGVLITPRSMLGIRDNNNIRKFDPVAVGILLRVLNADQKIKIVVSSTHRLHGNECLEDLARAGIKRRYIHEHWKTDNEGSHRGKQIDRWMQKYGQDVTDYCILDDDSDMLPDQLDRFVHTKGEVGLDHHDFMSMLEVLGIGMMGAGYGSSHN